MKGRISRAVIHRLASLFAVMVLAGCHDDDADVQASHRLVPLDEWTLVQDVTPWGARDAGAMAVHGRRLWVLGGWTHDKNGISQEFVDVWSSSDGIQWTSHPTPPWSFGMYQVAASDNGTLLLMAGLKNSRQSDEELSSEVWSTTDGETWTLLNPHAPWGPRMGTALLKFRGSLWLLGGKTRNSGDPQFFRNDVWRSLDGASWSPVTMSAPWAPRAFHCAVVHQDQMWVIGGGDWDALIARADVWSSRDGHTWVQHADAPWKGRIWHSCVSFRSAIWVLGGRTFEPIDTNDEIWRSQDGDNWEPFPSAARPTSRHAAYTAIYRNEIWTMGGGAHGHVEADVWRYPTLVPAWWIAPHEGGSSFVTRAEANPKAEQPRE